MSVDVSSILGGLTDVLAVGGGVFLVNVASKSLEWVRDVIGMGQAAAVSSADGWQDTVFTGEVIHLESWDDLPYDGDFHAEGWGRKDHDYWFGNEGAGHADEDRD